MDEERINRLAEDWTEKMFTVGSSGEHADRLALVVDEPGASGSEARYLAGWGREPFTYELKKLLRDVLR